MRSGYGVRSWQPVRWAVCACLLLVCAGGMTVRAQVQYARGQNVAPVFEGWEHNPDGTFSLVFGYLNRNYEEEIDIPIGPENRVDLGDDQGQPTHFYPRRQRFLFRVVVPGNWDKKRKVIWTLTSHGRTDQAKGWLQPEWELSDDVIIENLGGGVPDPSNKPPTLTIRPVQPVTLPDGAVLVASATDDGLPKPYQRAPSNPDRDSQPRRPRGVQIKWIHYRGPGAVTFTPDASPIVHGQPVELTAKATFSAPGTYVLRATAFDGQLSTTRDATVIVNNPTGSVQNPR
jgi:hypothetical protein